MAIGEIIGIYTLSSVASIWPVVTKAESLFWHSYDGMPGLIKAELSGLVAGFIKPTALNIY